MIWRRAEAGLLERPQLFRLMVQRVGDKPQILDVAMARTDARLHTRSRNDQRPGCAV